MEDGVDPFMVDPVAMVEGEARTTREGVTEADIDAVLTVIAHKIAEVIDLLDGLTTTLEGDSEDAS